MKSPYDIIIKPIITEKTTNLANNKLQYTFAVDPRANKVEIKNAIEEIFEVKVVAVRTINVRRKPKRMQKFEGFKPAYKKTIVRLMPGQTISVFEV